MQIFIVAHRSETPEAMLATVLQARLRDYPALKGRIYCVHIGAGGLQIPATSSTPKL